LFDAGRIAELTMRPLEVVEHQLRDIKPAEDDPDF
jgi:hypothetical protein